MSNILSAMRAELVAEWSEKNCDKPTENVKNVKMLPVNLLTVNSQSGYNSTKRVAFDLRNHEKNRN